MKLLFFVMLSGDYSLLCGEVDCVGRMRVEASLMFIRYRPVVNMLDGLGNRN